MKLKHIALSLIGAGLTLASCELDEKFYSEASPDTFYTSPENVYSILGRPFYQISYIWEQKWIWVQEEMTSDEMTAPAQGKDFYNNGEYVRCQEHTLTPDERIIFNPYNQIGYIMARAFEAREDLSGINYTALGLTDQDKADHINQLNCVVAHAYMLYLNQYGGVPIYESSQDAPKPRNTAKEVFDYIEKLLKDAIPQIKAKEDGASQTGYITKGGAVMMLAKLYMNAEAYTGEKRFAEAQTLLEDLIAGKYGKYDLDKTWYGPHSFTNDQSPEAVWNIPSEKNKFEPMGWYYRFSYISGADVYFDCAFPGSRYNGYMLSPSRETPDGPIYEDKMGCPYEKFHAKDLRKKPYFYKGNGEYEGMFCVGLQQNPRTGKIAIGTRGDCSGLEMVMVDCINADGKGSHMLNGAENSGVRLVKTPIPNTADIDMLFNPDIPMYRLTHAYYWLAECYWRDGKGAQAAALINKVRTRNFEGGVDPDPVPDNFDIYRLSDEYMIEFLGEGQRRTDLIRLGLFTTESWWAHKPSGKDKALFPIPTDAITANPLLEQNPGY